MSMLRITVGSLEFTARMEEENAPKTCAAFKKLLPFKNKLVQARWSGESAWIPLGDFQVGIGYENHTSHPAPGEILLYPGGYSETEILFPYGATCFASKLGQLAGNHFLNFDAGNMPAGDRGLLSDPVRQEQFRENVPIALELASQLGTRKLNALVGRQLPDLTRDEQLELARKNVTWAADQAQKQGSEILIEAVNTFENGPYLLSRTEQAVRFIESVGKENVKLQYDVYHMQRMEGNLITT